MNNTENTELLTLCQKVKRLREAQRSYVYKVQNSPLSETIKVHKELNEIEQDLDLFVESLTQKIQEDEK